MLVTQWNADLAGWLQPQLADFEADFVYPLGAAAGFRISHQPEYPRFFHSLGTAASTWVLHRQHTLVGVFSAVTRHLQQPGQQPLSALYLGDLRLAAEHRRQHALWQLCRAMQSQHPQNTAAFSIVMTGTAVTPVDYSGRLGLPALRPLADLAILQLATAPAAPELQPLPPAAGATLFATLAGDCVWSLSGQPALRSRHPPQWWATPDGNACGRLEDSALAKQLRHSDGRSLPCAHLACWSYRTPAAALRLLHGALGQAARLGWPTLFTALAWPRWLQLQQHLADFQPQLASATVYGAGLADGQDWCWSTSEI